MAVKIANEEQWKKVVVQRWINAFYCIPYFYGNHGIFKLYHSKAPSSFDYLHKYKAKIIKQGKIKTRIRNFISKSQKIGTKKTKVNKFIKEYGWKISSLKKIGTKKDDYYTAIIQPVKTKIEKNNSMILIGVVKQGNNISMFDFSIQFIKKNFLNHLYRVVYDSIDSRVSAIDRKCDLFRNVIVYDSIDSRVSDIDRKYGLFRNVKDFAKKNRWKKKELLFLKTGKNIIWKKINIKKKININSIVSFNYLGMPDESQTFEFINGSFIIEKDFFTRQPGGGVIKKEIMTIESDEYYKKNFDIYPSIVRNNYNSAYSSVINSSLYQEIFNKNAYIDLKSSVLERMIVDRRFFPLFVGSSSIGKEGEMLPTISFFPSQKDEEIFEFSPSSYRYSESRKREVGEFSPSPYLTSSLLPFKIVNYTWKYPDEYIEYSLLRKEFSEFIGSENKLSILSKCHNVFATNPRMDTFVDRKIFKATMFETYYYFHPMGIKGRTASRLFDYYFHPVGIKGKSASHLFNYSFLPISLTKPYNGVEYDLWLPQGRIDTDVKGEPYSYFLYIDVFPAKIIKQGFLLGKLNKFPWDPSVPIIGHEWIYDVMPLKIENIHNAVSVLTLMQVGIGYTEPPQVDIQQKFLDTETKEWFSLPSTLTAVIPAKEVFGDVIEQKNYGGKIVDRAKVETIPFSEYIETKRDIWIFGITYTLHIHGVVLTEKQSFSGFFSGESFGADLL